MNPNEKKIRIAAVVVTYNRKKLLKECIEALLKQTYPLSSIIIIDNASTDGTEQYMKDSGYMDCTKIEYIRLAENMGGSGGFHKGMRLAYERGYGWFWIMDDDVEPQINALEELLNAISIYNNENEIVVTPILIAQNNVVLSYDRGLVNFEDMINRAVLFAKSDVEAKKHELITSTSFVGPLIPQALVEKIGYPNEQFFIYYDDVEYSIRMSRVCKIFLIPNSIIVHKREASSENSPKGKIFFKESTSPRIEIHKFWRQYYGIRNIVYLSKKYQTDRLKFYSALIKNIFKTIIGYILYDNFKWRRILLVVKAYHNGLTERLGKRVDPHTWHKSLEAKSI